MPSAATWMDLEDIMLSEISQRQKNTAWYHLHVESKKYNKVVNTIKRSRLTNTENKLVVWVGGGEIQGWESERHKLLGVR